MFIFQYTKQKKWSTNTITKIKDQIVLDKSYEKYYIFI